MVQGRDLLLSSILGCGYLDLSVLDDCEYDFDEMVEECKFNFGEISLNGLARTMFAMGIRDIEEWINNRIEEIKGEMEYFYFEDGENEEDDEEYMMLRKELEELEELKPWEDIESFHNYLDTSIYFIDNGETYNTYCEEALKEFECNTGYSISG